MDKKNQATEQPIIPKLYLTIKFKIKHKRCQLTKAKKTATTNVGNSHEKPKKQKTKEFGNTRYIITNQIIEIHI